MKSTRQHLTFNFAAALEIGSSALPVQAGGGKRNMLDKLEGRANVVALLGASCHLRNT